MLTAIIYYEQDKGSSPSLAELGWAVQAARVLSLKQGFLKSFHQCSATFVQVKLQLKVQRLNNQMGFNSFRETTLKFHNLIHFWF